MKKMSHSLRIILLLISLIVVGKVFAQAGQPSPVKTISSLDVPRYLGTWYEISKFPNWFQKKCQSNTKAVYSLRSDGNLQVVNSCKTVSGEVTEAVGAARQIGPRDSAKLEVRFAPEWLSFLPMVWGDYWIVDLDSQYELAAVSDPKREYLWVLSRTPQLDPKAYAALLQRLQEQQFDTHQLELTLQK